MLNILSQKKHMYELPWNNTLWTKLKKEIKKEGKNNIVLQYLNNFVRKSPLKKAFYKQYRHNN